MQPLSNLVPVVILCLLYLFQDSVDDDSDFWEHEFNPEDGWIF